MVARFLAADLAAGLSALAMLFSGGVMAQPDLPALQRQVETTERAFARSMAERDLAAFSRHLAGPAVFFGDGPPLRGKAAVTEAWKAYFAGPQAPFSWESDRVEVLADGSLAHSTGPVRNPAGKPIARFNSIWRQEAPGVWRIVFDQGEAWRD